MANLIGLNANNKPEDVTVVDGRILVSSTDSITESPIGTNSTTTPLASGATFTGTGEQNNQPDVMVSCTTDNSGTLFFDFSVDDTNYGTFPTAGFAVAAGIHEFHIAVKGPRYFRVRLVNDSGAQSYLRLYTYYGIFNKPNAPLNQALSADSDAITVKAVISGQNPDGNYSNTSVNETGNLITGDFLTEVSKGNVAGHSLVRKFGRNGDIDTAAIETIWANGGLYVFPPTAQTLSISSSDAADTLTSGTGAWTLQIDGLDTNYDEISETVNLNGTSTVTTTAEFLRVIRGRVTSAGSGGANAGILTVQQTTSAIIMAGMSAGINQSQLGVYTVPNAKSARILGLIVTATKGASSAVDVSMFIRSFGEVFQLKGTYGSHTTVGGTPYEFLAPISVAAKSDIRFDASVSANNTQVGIEFPMLVVDD